MEPIKLLNLSVKRKKAPGPWQDFWHISRGFFVFFGVSGVDHGREERMERRFEQEHYRNQVTVRLSGRVVPGQYTFQELSGYVNRRGWTVHENGTATNDLSDEALAELRTWMERGPRTAHLLPL